MKLEVNVTVEDALKLYREKDICVLSGSKELKEIKKKFEQAKKEKDKLEMDHLTREYELVELSYLDTIYPYFCKVEGIEKDLDFYYSFNEEFTKQMTSTFRPQRVDDTGKQEVEKQEN